MCTHILERDKNGIVKHFGTMEEFIKFAQAIQEVVQKVAPEYAAEQKVYADKLRARGVQSIPGTDFFTVYLKKVMVWVSNERKKMEGELHKDRLDGMSSVSVILVEDYGAIFAFPEHELAYVIQSGDILIFDSLSYHTYCELLGREDSQRMVLTFFYNVNLDKRSTGPKKVPDIKPYPAEFGVGG